ncbi:helicase-exonuclease AddAB subunit AddA [Fructilactobacillus vespulae]|uniref:helicase-exonuclease AddAB subunit AddA n=1 Tax=Fructilactobacillus vespulae TaxID=1249630 RepID=UPI0039B5CCEC
MAREWTEGQRQAIYTDFPGNALVSASAGSGKTSVLTERVMQKVAGFEERPGIDIDQMLIVTFTNAAAKEMRDRIHAALKEAVNQSESDEKKQYFLKQIRKLNSAHIETMDAFCQWLVKKYYYVIDLDPDFRILTDVSELGIIRDQVWAELREDLYANDQDGSFKALTRNFSSDRNDDGLTEILFKLYDFANVNENPTEWLAQLVNFYQIDGSLTNSNLYQQYLLPDIQNRLQQAIDASEQLAQKAEKFGLIKIYEFVQSEANDLKDLQDAATQLSWDELRTKFVEFKFGARMPSIPKKDLDEAQTVVKKEITAGRNQPKDDLKALISDYFFANEADNYATIEAAQKLVQKLVETVTAFSAKYTAAKQKRHAYEFIDIEHFALNILNDDSETGNNIREQFQEYFAEIMVDEYQDNNHLQDAILTTIKNPKRENMFMVGDVKQSIYRFRLADPSMFMAKYNQYPKSAENTRITLPDNFRSVKNVDDFTNLIFEQIMNSALGEIDYTGDAHLQFGAKDYPESLDTKTEIMIYKDDGENAGEIITNEQQQIKMIANRINQLLNDHYQIYDRKAQTTRDIQFADIAILASTKRNNFDISNIFAEQKIPVAIDGSESYFKTTEVQIMMSLLQIIDNPYQDIPLVAVLRSPMIQMDENQLAFLRINQKTGNYFQSVLNFQANAATEVKNDFGEVVKQKVDLFLTQLTAFRDYAVKHSLAELIWYIYDQTGFLDYIGGMPAGKKRQANLHALYQRAAEYERNGFKGLFAFVNFIKRLQNRDDDLAEASVESNPDAVTVKTIHGSKGLEYPVVFVMDATHGFNEMDLKSSFILDDDLGVGIQRLDEIHHLKIPTLQYRAIGNLAKKRMLAEEMRKLYVALTRAKQKLIITGISKNKSQKDAETSLLDDWSKGIQSSELVLKESERSGAHNFMDWIGTALVRHPIFMEEFGTETNDHLLQTDPAKFDVKFVSDADLQKNVSHETMTTAATEIETGSADLDFIKQILDFNYQYDSATKTTAYQSVSEIKGQFDDPDIIQLGSLVDQPNQVLKQTRYNSGSFATPKFLQTAQEPSASEIGTATHFVLAKVNVYERIDEESVQNLIDSFVSDGLLTKEVAPKINVAAIVRFYQSDLGKRILLYPENLKREVPFSLIINAGQLFSEFENDAEQKLLVHGIIDGYFIDPDVGPVLFDYKTSFVNPGHPDADIAKITDQYRGQLNLYAKALADILQQPINKKQLYLLANGEFIDV